MEKMASPISFIQRTDRCSRCAFTLAEVMIGASISSFLLVGILSTFLLMGRTSANIVNYTDIEAKARTSLEIFSREVHNAHAVTAYSATSVSLSIPDTTSSDPHGTGTGAYNVTYTFDTANKLLTRTGPPLSNPAGTVATTTMVQGVQLVPGTSSFLNYYRYIRQTSYPLGQGYIDGFTTNTAANITEIKQIEVSFLLEKKDVTVVAATNKVLSARFILRNK
jgi:Tfp pilus assembly protein PilW